MLNLKEFVMWGALVLGGLILVYTKGHSDATDTLTIAHQSQLLAASQRLEEQRVAQQAALAAINEKWLSASATPSVSSAPVLADLRDRNIRLRVQLADAIVSSVTGGGGSEPDGYAELHPDASRFLVEQAQRADAQVTALQDTVRVLKGETK